VGVSPSGDHDRLIVTKEREGNSSILILVPTLNEEKGISSTLKELIEVFGQCKFLVVDGCSSDGTVDTSKSLGADVIHQKGRGKGNAVGYAIEYIDDGCDYVVLIDGDYTYPAKYIPQMVEILEQNPHVGMVCGNRFNANLHLSTIGYILYFGNRLIAFVHNLLNGVALQDPLTGLRVVRGKLIRNWKPKSAGFDMEVELNHYIERQGYNIREIAISYRERVGKKKLKIKDGIIILRRILIESIHGIKSI
jgi:glycosyltransferase involved in cell wall biosynthesis